MLKNSSSTRSIRATVRVNSTPNPGTYPQDNVVFVAPGQSVSIGCSRESWAGGATQVFSFKIVGSEFTT